jgi:hypothetical protein
MVSSADEKLLSTASTLAPSWAKRKTVARPVPKPPAWRLTGAYDDGDLVLETHANLGKTRVTLMPP